jgi:BirA family transcriptional regulator, biotin operon repressor / biotin---[acetyl-CoA-carboxylase] ligase
VRLGGTRFDVRRFARLDSTNRYLIEEAARGAPAGTVAVADEQTEGRGRLGRSWLAPPGASLLVSVLLRPRLAPERLALLTMAAGLAAIDAVAAIGGFDARLKWPNDVVVDDKKLAGILAEKVGDAVVIGMGLNVQWESFPDELAGVATACNRHSNHPVRRDDLLVSWLGALQVRLDALDRIVEDARAHSATLGRRVLVETEGRAFAANAIELTDEGHLVVRDDEGNERVVAAGDVIHLRPE